MIQSESKAKITNAVDNLKDELIQLVSDAVKRAEPVTLQGNMV
jgi:hypothetical protein